MDESGLVSGGDLSGPLSNAQVSEAGLTVGGDLTGTAANAQIGSGVVGPNEIADGVRPFVIGAEELGTAATNEVGEPDLGEQNGFPAVLFDGAANETLDLIVPVPDDLDGTGFVRSSLWFSAPADGTVRWTAGIARLVPGSTDTLAGATNGSTATMNAPILNGRVVKAVSSGAGLSSTAPGDLFRVQITRDAVSGTDNIAADAALLAVEVRFDTVR